MNRESEAHLESLFPRTHRVSVHMMLGWMMVMTKPESEEKVMPGFAVWRTPPNNRLGFSRAVGGLSGFTMALSSSPSFCFCPSVSTDVLAFTARSSSHLYQYQNKGLRRISCKAEDSIGSKRRGRRGGKRDPLMDEKESVWPYLETQERMIVDLNKQLLVDTENLLHRANNKFGLVLEIAEEANEYLRHNKDEALTKKPILKVISDKINEAAGENIRDAYCEETLDPQE